jgi:hypothetical protein
LENFKIGKRNLKVNKVLRLKSYKERDYIFDVDYSGRIREKAYWDQFTAARIGYRYQKPDSGFFFKGYTPMVGFCNSVAADKSVNFTI